MATTRAKAPEPAPPDPEELVPVRIGARHIRVDGLRELISGQTYPVPRRQAATWYLLGYATPEVAFSSEELSDYIDVAVAELRAGRGASWDTIPAVRRKLERIDELTRPRTGPEGEAA